MRAVVTNDLILALDAPPEILTLFSVTEVVVAEVEGEMLGFSGTRRAYISWLFVQPAHQIKDIALALVCNVISKI